MAGNWLSEFGFIKNPYDTMALSASEEGSRLLVGRDEEVSFLMQQLTASSMIPLLYGENGVGKSSIANVVAYRLSQAFDRGDERYFFLKLKRIQSTQLSDLIAFEKSVYQEIMYLLLDNKDFLVERGISKTEINQVNQLVCQMGSIGVGGGIGPISLNLDYTPNPSAESNLLNIVRKWMEICFSGCYSGGIICIIDNLENSGTPNQVKSLIESLRDTLFTMPGLLWILCGTPVAVEGVRSSKLLQGYFAERKILSVDENIVPKVVERRIDYYGKTEADPPVDKELFEILYQIVNKQLRVAFTICQEFAVFLYNHAIWRTNDRKSEFKTWLDQMASNLPEKEHEVPDESWNLFDRIVMFGPDISDYDLKMLNPSQSDELNALLFPLKAKRLIDIVEIDNGFVVRVTRDGWLVNYKRHNYSLGRNLNGTRSSC